jgi:uncharacterized membrane protein (DUF4010 family)
MNALAWPLELRFALALGLGLLIGVERERTVVALRRSGAGVRTHALVSLLGFALGWFGEHAGMGLPIAGFVGLTGIVIAGFVARVREGAHGWTSEVAVLLSFTTGLLCVHAPVWLPMAVGIVSTFLLSEKTLLEGYAGHLDEKEFLGVLKFLLLGLIVLPALPDQGYTQFDINPARIWKIVVLVSSVGFVGYFLTKRYGGKVGLWLSGVLGGIVSSTAVAVAAGRMARQNPAIGPAALQASLLASAVMYLRILAIVWFISPNFGQILSWRLVLLCLVGLGLAAFVHGESQESQGVTSASNPFELKPAFLFGAFFVILTVVTRVVKESFGQAGLVALSLIVGAVDIDPFILSLHRGVGAVEPILGCACLFSMLSNTVAKGIYFGTISGSMKKPAFIRYGAWALLHIPVALSFFWI